MNIRADEPIIRDARDRDGPAVAAILNHAIATSTATWALPHETVDARARGWLEAARTRDLPVLVAELGDLVAGFASYAPFRARGGYRYSVECSVYVAEGVRRSGVGRRLLEHLIQRAADAGMHVMVAAIDAENAGGLGLHRSLRFEEVGRLPEVGRKFGTWRTLVLMQRILAPSS